jgi:hypothetical protein
MGNACCGGKPGERAGGSKHGQAAGAAARPPPPPPPPRLRVAVLEARGLKSMSRLASNDPYATVRLSTAAGAGGGSIATTAVDSGGGGSTASWQVEAVFPAAQLATELAAPGGAVVLSVLDRRRRSPPDVLIGECRLRIRADLQPESALDGDPDLWAKPPGWYPIFAAGGGKRHGEVFLGFSTEPEPPAAEAAAPAGVTMAAAATAPPAGQVGADELAAVLDAAGRVMAASGVSAEQVVAAATPAAAAAAPHVRKAAQDRYSTEGGFGRAVGDAKMVAGVTARVAGNPTARRLAAAGGGALLKGMAAAAR